VRRRCPSPSERSNLAIYTLYSSILKGLSRTGIPLLLLSLLCILYFGGCGSNFPLNTSYDSIWSLSLFLGGSHDHLKNLRWLIVKRVSTSSQGQGPSLEEQGQQSRELVAHFDGEIVEEIEFEESATTLDKEQFDKIRELAEEDEYDVLVVSQLNRLTRADAWEAIDFMKTLYLNDVILCTADHGPYDWDDIDDFDEITNGIVLARKHVLEIKEGQKRNWRNKLQNKKWSLGEDPPTLIKLDNDDNMRLKDGAEFVANEIYNKYIETENMKAAHRHIKKILPKGEIHELSYNQILRLIGDRQLIGQFPRSGEVLAKHEDLRLISDRKYKEAVKIREETNSNDEAEILENIEEAFSRYCDRFGPLSAVINVLVRFRPVCEECEGIMEWDKNKTGQSLGVTVPRFECPDCGFERSIPSKEEMKQMTDVLPLRCPYCINCENFSVSEIKEAGSVFDYRYTCAMCGHSWGSNMSPVEVRRLLDHPELKFSIDDESLEPNEREENRKLTSF